MKKTLKTVIAGLLLATLLGGTAWAQGRTATVDLSRLFSKYWKTQQADAVIKDRVADMEKDNKAMLEDRKKATDEYQALLADSSNQALSSDEREKRKRSAEEKLKFIKDTEESIANFQRNARATLEEQSQRMRANLLGEIRNAVTAKAKAAGYTMVIDIAAESVNKTPVVLYSADDANDLTDAVLTQLNIGAPVDAAKTEEKPAPKPEEKKKK